jgi:hypothetical protein
VENVKAISNISVATSISHYIIIAKFSGVFNIRFWHQRRAMALLAQHKPHRLTMTIRQLLSLLLLFSVTNMNLACPRKQRHIMKVALASTATLLKLLESQTAESIVFASLL